MTIHNKSPLLYGLLLAGGVLFTGLITDFGGSEKTLARKTVAGKDVTLEKSEIWPAQNPSPLITIALSVEDTVGTKIYTHNYDPWDSSSHYFVDKYEEFPSVPGWKNLLPRGPTTQYYFSRRDVDTLQERIQEEFDAYLDSLRSAS